MFEELFRAELKARQLEQVRIDELWWEIDGQYAKNHRHYHNHEHLDNLAAELLPVKESIVNWSEVVMAIAYHDVVYNTLKQDNEEQSARLASKRMSDMGFSAEAIARVHAMILATKTHLHDSNTDTNYFTDADLAVLGYSPVQYKLYSQSIRKEYRLYPEFLYKPGRKKVLEHFLSMPRIYKTDHFFNKYEQQARVNIAAELQTY